MSTNANIAKRELAKALAGTGWAPERLERFVALFEPDELSGEKINAWFASARTGIETLVLAKATETAVQPMHVTFSTRFAGEAYQRSMDAAERFEKAGCTKYNPNGDCEQKEGDAVKGQSNWLLSFRERGLETSLATHGFVAQLQEDAQRVRTDMQVAEEGMAIEIGKVGAPVMGIYGDIRPKDVTVAVYLAARQWESGTIEQSAVAVEEHYKIGDDGAVWLAERLGSSLGWLKVVALDGCGITDEGAVAIGGALKVTGALTILM